MNNIYKENNLKLSGRGYKTLGKNINAYMGNKYKK